MNSKIDNQLAIALELEEKVRENSGVMLEPEVIMLGEFGG